MSAAAAPTGSVTALLGRADRMLDRVLGPTGRQGVWAVGDRLIVAGTNFLTLVIVGRAAGVEALGVFALAWTVLLTANALGESFVTSPFTVFANRPRAALGRARYAGTALLLHLALAGLATALCCAVALVLTAREAPALMHDAAWCLAVALPASALREFARRFLFARFAAWRALVLDAAAALLQLAAILALWAGAALTPATALLAIALGTGLPALAWLVAARRAFRPPLAGGVRREARRHLVFARWLAGAQLSDLAVTHGVAWWVAAFAGTAATGLFSAANSLVLVINPLMLGVGSVLLPRTALAQHRQGPHEVARIVWKVTLWLAGAAGLVCLLVALLGGWLIEMLYGIEATATVAATVALLALAGFAGATAFAVDNGLMVVGRQDANFVASLVGLVATFAGAAVLLPPLGLVGAALAVALGTGVNALWQIVVFARFTRAPGAGT